MKLENERKMEKEREEREVRMAGVRAKAEAEARIGQELEHEDFFKQKREHQVGGLNTKMP